MKRGLFVLFVFSISNILFAQNAYKNFNWGMSIEQIREICPDLEKKEESDIWSSDFLVLGVHLNTILNRTLISPPELIVGGNTYISPSNNLSFYFEDNKLTCINVKNFEGIVRDDLIKRYGEPVVFQNTSYTQRYMGELYIKEQNRFILTGVRYFSGINSIGKLIYIDKEWITQKFNDYFIEYKNDYDSRADSILD